MDKAIAYRMFRWIDWFHDNLDTVNTASIKMKYLCRKLRFWTTNFATKCYMESCFFKGKPRQLCLMRASRCRYMIYGGTIPLGWSAPPLLGRNIISRCQLTRWLQRKFPQKLESLLHIIVDCVNEWELPHWYSSWTRLIWMSLRS